MANKKISAWDASTTAPANTDAFPTIENMTVGTKAHKRKAWSVLMAGIAAYTQTLTNKRITPRIYTIASIAGAPGVLTPEIDTYNYYELTAQAAPLNIANMSTSTPTGGEMIIIAITTAAARALTYGTDYVAKAGIALPTTTVAGKTTTLGFQRNAGLAAWNLLAVGQEA